jgi:hypothetical protein
VGDGEEGEHLREFLRVWRHFVAVEDDLGGWGRHVGGLDRVAWVIQRRMEDGRKRERLGRVPMIWNAVRSRGNRKGFQVEFAQMDERGGRLARGVSDPYLHY